MAGELASGIWVKNRFRILEERLARLEESAHTWGAQEERAIGASLVADGLTVGRLRTLLAGFDPRTPVIFCIGADTDTSYTEADVWSGVRSTPLHSILARTAVVRIEHPVQERLDLC